MIIYIDIDETICHSVPPDYEKAIPIQANIDKANALFDAGHTIIYWTARGATTGINYKRVTYKQFRKWGVMHDDIRFDKPFFDLFIDDKVLNTKDWADALEGECHAG